jgi:hypothetical protein
MSDFNTFDRVRTTRDLPPIPSGTFGTVMDATGIQLIVKYDGDSSPGRLTPRDGVVRVSGSLSALATTTVSVEETSVEGAASARPLFGDARITAAAGPSAAHTSISNTIPGQVVVLFDDAVVDLQTDGPLCGAWAGTISFPLSPVLEENADVLIDVRGAIEKTPGAAALAALVLEGDARERRFSFGSTKTGNYFWRVEQRLRRGTATHPLILLLAAERRSVEDNVLITIDSIDIVLQ